MGAHIDELDAAWGNLLARGGKFPDGTASYTYSWFETFTVPAETYWDSFKNKTIVINTERTESYYCRTEVSVNANGIIRNIYQGVGRDSNGCGNMYPPPSRPKATTAPSTSQ
jgi:hypothetical protein